MTRTEITQVFVRRTAESDVKSVLSDTSLPTRTGTGRERSPPGAGTTGKQPGSRRTSGVADVAAAHCWRTVAVSDTSGNRPAAKGGA